MTVINKKLLQQRTERLALGNHTSRETVGYLKATTVGILFSQTDRIKYNAVRTLAKQLKLDGKNVDVLCYLGKNGENFDFRYDYITSQDVTMWGKMQSRSALTFAEQSFDYLFYLDPTENIYLENILAMSKAKCRIGIYGKNRNDLLELMLSFNGNSSIEEVIEKIFFYTQKLGCNGN